MFITETYFGKIVQVYPGQGWGIIQSCRYPESKAVFLLRDQRGLDKKGNIDPERIRTTAPEIETIVKFTIDRSRKTLDGAMVFLWAKQHQGPRKKKLPQAHFYPSEQYQKKVIAAATVPDEQRPAPVIAQEPVLELSSAETNTKNVQDQKSADNAVQANQLKIKNPVAQETAQSSVQNSQRVAQNSGHGLPGWAAKEGVAILKGGGRVRLGI